MDGAFGLGPSHVNEGLAMRNHLAGCDKESSKFRFCCRSHNILDDLGIGKHSAVEPQKGIVFGEIDVCSRTAPRLGFVKEARIGMITEDNVTSTVDDAIVQIRGHIIK